MFTLDCVDKLDLLFLLVYSIIRKSWCQDISRNHISLIFPKMYIEKSRTGEDTTLEH